MTSAEPDPIVHPLLRRAGLRHGFFTRAGGVSRALYAGLNTGVGSGDDPVAVGENRRRVAASLGGTPDDLAACYQIHSAITRIAEGPWRGDRPEGDAVVSATPGNLSSSSRTTCSSRSPAKRSRRTRPASSSSPRRMTLPATPVVCSLPAAPPATGTPS